MSETDGTEAVIPNGVEKDVMNMKVQVGDAVFSATLEENEAVASFVEMMRENPVSIQMSDYSGFAKVGSLGTSLPVNNSHEDGCYEWYHQNVEDVDNSAFYGGIL